MMTKHMNPLLLDEGVQPRLSRYTFPFEREGHRLVFNSRTRNFHEVNEALFDILKDFSPENVAQLDEDTLAQMHSLKWIATEQEDEDYVLGLHNEHLIRTYDPTSLGLTIAPTVSCNLACPYCFEGSDKPKGIMSEKTCKKVLKFIRAHEKARSVSITWYGGEPLLAPDVIERILESVTKMRGKKFVSHNIITNATLITERVIEIFKRFPLRNMQVTLDGMPATHDTRRITHAGAGTFDKIMANLERFATECPETSISIRVNVDRNNAAEFQQIVNMMRQRFPKKENLFVYPGIIQGDYDCAPDTSLLTGNSLMEFYRDGARKGIAFKPYPTPEFKGCSATNPTSYVIGPQGEIYNCWEEVGKREAVIGNVADSEYSSPETPTRYMMLGTAFADDNCRRCAMLPICQGGCPRHRIHNLSKPVHRIDLCNIYSQNDGEALYDFLFDYYKTTKCNRQNCNCNA